MGRQFGGGALFDILSDEYTIRTPKREGSYVAQLWAYDGWWECEGLYPTKLHAHNAAAILSEQEPVPGADHGTARWVRARSTLNTSRYPGVRKVKGFSWQARPWLGGSIGNLNLGLFSTRSEWGSDAEWAAGRAAKEFCRRWMPGRTVGSVVSELQRMGYVPAEVVVPERVAGIVARSVPVEEPRPRARMVRIRPRYISDGLFHGCRGYYVPTRVSVACAA